MKTIKIILLFTVLVAVALFSSCGEGDEPGISFDEQMNGTWTISSVTRDGSDVTSEFGGFQLTLSFYGPNTGGGGYTVINANNVLFESGNYTLNGATSMNLNGNDGTNINAQISLSEDGSSLTFSFYNPTTMFGGGRVSGAAGDYVFVLTK